MFDTPILFLIYNRPSHTQKVFNEIKKMQPKTLYISADGPKNEADSIKCARVRSIVEEVDWKCDVKTLYREKNLGCKKAISSGISWFFDNVDAGIILEDDCLPSKDFFHFCKKMLTRYKDDERVMLISGTNQLEEVDKLDSDYFFARFYSIWGWASWKRAWDHYDLNMHMWPGYRKTKSLQQFFCNEKVSTYWNSSFDSAYNNLIDTWDIQWSYSCLFNNGLAIIPTKNLISNIGLTGTRKGSKNGFLFLNKIAFNSDKLQEPKQVFPNLKIENRLYNTILQAPSSPKRNLIMLLKKIRAFKYLKLIKRKLNK